MPDLQQPSLTQILDLGNQVLTSVFPKRRDQAITKGRCIWSNA